MKIGTEIEGIPVLGNLNQAQDVVLENNIHHVIVALPLEKHQEFIPVSKKLRKAGVRVHVIPDLFTLSFPGVNVDGLGGIPFIDLGISGSIRSHHIIKRIFDILSVTLILVLLSPFLILIAFLIMFDSKGPILYKQKRIGKGGQVFTMYKFRTMKLGSSSTQHQEYVVRLISENISPEEINGAHGSSFKMENDPRITRVGKLIRKTSIDEIPQLLNVLQGDMSLVGPRPPLPYEVEVYQEWHKRRFEVLPGITGFWQVKARNRVSFNEMIRLDLEYIERQSFWLDLLIILQTPWALISGRGAG
ncbi:MAG: sugar transferase [Dehalococcoidia bacterium]